MKRQWQRVKEGEEIQIGDICCWVDASMIDFEVKRQEESGFIGTFIVTNDSIYIIFDPNAKMVGMTPYQINNSIKKIGIHQVLVFWTSKELETKKTIIKGENISEHEAMKIFFNTPAGQWGGYKLAKS